MVPRTSSRSILLESDLPSSPPFCAGSLACAALLLIPPEEEAALYSGARDDEDLVVVCPPGVRAGDAVAITTDGGVELTVDVPDGVAPGDEFTVAVHG